MTNTVTIGRIVHYVLPLTARNAGQVRPAIITRVWQQLDYESHPGMSNLRVFLDGGNDQDPHANPQYPEWVGSVCYDADGALGTWHWPPRA